MTKRPTPETNAVLARLVKNQTGNSCDAVVIHHARKLERERDEAMERIERQKLEIVRLNGATNHAGGTPLKIALKERDEAREALENEMKWHHRTHTELVQTQCKLLDMEMKCDQLQDEIKRLKVILDLIKKDVS